uniref:SET domain-containing protein n=1 Tax=Romanomermis culicivorax TaxID=13658 RepID=A0A915KQ54_ROMCU
MKPGSCFCSLLGEHAQGKFARRAEYDRNNKKCDVILIKVVYMIYNALIMMKFKSRFEDMLVLYLFLFVLTCHNPINILFDAEYNLIEIQFLEYASDRFNKHLRFNLAYQLQYNFGYGFCITDNVQHTKSRIVYREAACDQNLKVLEDTNSKRRRYSKKQKSKKQNENNILEHVKLSLPCYLYINTSTIAGGGRGVYTKVPLTTGAIFGPYAGIQRSKSQMSNKDPSRAWTISGGADGDFYIDGSNENKSNWLRYVNCARSVGGPFRSVEKGKYEYPLKGQFGVAVSARIAEEQNVYPLQLERNIYYYLFRNVKAGDELLTWYGESYGRSLGIEFERNYYSKRSSKIGLAPQKTETNFAGTEWILTRTTTREEKCDFAIFVHLLWTGFWTF